MKISAIAAFSLTLAISSACGRNGATRSSGDGSPSVRGDILVGTQCPLGTISKPVQGGFVLRNCRNGMAELEITEPPAPILLTGDCAEKTIGIRTSDGTVDTLWQTLPDGSFSVAAAGPRARLASDGSGHEQCLSNMTMEISGKMDCIERDILSIRIKSMRLWMRTPSPEESATLQAPGCELPKGCRLETQLELRQCG